jgi:hypothetical protein
MHLYYASRTKTVEYITILATPIFKLFNDAGSNIQVVRVQCDSKLIMQAEKVTLCGTSWSCSEVRHSSGETEEDHECFTC